MNASQNLTDPKFLPEPKWIAVPSHDELMEEIRADFLRDHPKLADEVNWESTFISKQFGIMATREIKLRMLFNDMLSEFTLAYGKGVGPVMIGDNFDVKRRIIDKGDPNASPPKPIIYEPLDEFKKRIRLSNSASFFGHETSYQFWGLNQDASLCDISVIRPQAGYIDLYLLARDGDGAPSPETMTRMRAYFSSGDWEGIVDKLGVHPAKIIKKQIHAKLILLRGPHQEKILQEAKTSLQKLLKRPRALGEDLTRDRITAALMVKGVHSVDLITPAKDITADLSQFVFIEYGRVEMGGENG